MAQLCKPVHLLVLSAAMMGSTAGAPRVEVGEVTMVDRARAAESLTRGRAVRATLEFGQAIQSRYAAVGDRGWLFTGTADARVLIEASARDATDPELSIYGPRAEGGWTRTAPLARNDDYRRGSLNARAELTLPSDGTYLVVVREHASRPGTFTLSLRCGNLSVARDGACEAAPISLGAL